MTPTIDDVIGAIPAWAGHAVEAEPRHHRDKIGFRILHRGAVRRRPFEPCVLHRILGVGPASKHAISEPEQSTPMRFENI